jgi:hypothetical protein
MQPIRGCRQVANDGAHQRPASRERDGRRVGCSSVLALTRSHQSRRHYLVSIALADSSSVRFTVGETLTAWSQHRDRDRPRDNVKDHQSC